MFSSLTSRLVLLVSAAIFVVVAATSAVYHREYGALLSERIVEAIQQDMSTGANHFERQADEYRASLKFLLMSPPLKSVQDHRYAVHRPHFPALFRTYVAANPNVLQIEYVSSDPAEQSLFVFRRNGEVIAESGSAYSPFQTKDYLAMVKDVAEGQIINSEVRLLRDAQGELVSPMRSAMVYATPIYKSGELHGVLAFHVSVNAVFEQERSSIEFLESYLPGSQNFIVNAKGDYILHPDSQKAMRYEFNERGNIVDDWPEIETFIDDKDDGSAFLYSDAGKHIIIVERFNAGTELHPNSFFLVLVAPLDSVFSDLYQLQIYIVFFSFSMVLLVVLISGTYIRRKLLPLQRLSRRMRDFDPGLPFKPMSLASSGEIASVTRSFNQSSQQLRELFLQERVMREGLDKFAIVSTMDTNGLMLYVNDKFCQFFGYQREEILGQPVKKYRSGLHSAETYEALWNSARAGQVWREDLSYRAKDGTVLWMETAVVPLCDRDGNVDRVLNIQFDITDRRRLLNEVQKQRNKAEQASRVKSDFLASMSHELRTPLNSIIGFSQRLKRKLKSELSPRDMDAVETIERNGQHLLQVINEILDVAKVESGKMTVTPSQFDLRAVVREVRQTMLPQAKKHKLTLKEHLPETEVEVILDRKKVVQVLLNLVSNAIKYTEQGDIDITLEERPEGVVLEVTDTGIGIREQDIPKLFRRFTQLESNLHGVIEGTGLGLVLVEEFASMMGGKVSVSSVYGSGTTFTVILPKVMHVADPVS